LAVAAALGDLVAEQGAGETADDGALVAVAAAGDGAAGDRADAGADDGAGHAVGLALFAGLLGQGGGGKKGRDGDAGDQGLNAHKKSPEKGDVPFLTPGERSLSALVQV
jgi:hypothetical protein